MIVKKKELNRTEIADALFVRFPQLVVCRADFEKAYNVFARCYRHGGKVLVAGNGGSAADSEHIVGELMKSFLFNRKIDTALAVNLEEMFGEQGAALAQKLEGALSAIPLTSMSALTSAFANDVDAAVSFAQMINGYGSNGDVFWGITTSGNSKNILYALMTAKAKGLTTVVLTGDTGGKSRDLADITICVPEKETFKIQELHLPIYHALCAMLEADFFEER